MKRSEMVENIASELIHPDLGLPNWDVAKEMAEIILKRIEKEGMLPPNNATFNESKIEHKWKKEND